MERAKELKKKYDEDPRVKKNALLKPLFIREKKYSDIYLIKAKKESILHPPKERILLSHLSPNRFLNNFHMKDPRFIINAFLLDVPTVDGLVLLDSKSVEKMRLKFKGFHETLD